MRLLRPRHEQLQGRLSVSAGQLDHQHAAEKSILRFAEGNYRGDVVRGFTLQIGATVVVVDGAIYTLWRLGVL